MAKDYDWHPDTAKGGSVFKVETRNLGWWIFLAILVSILLHIILYVVLTRWEQTKRANEEESFRQVSEQQPTIDRSTLDQLLAQSKPILDDVVEPTNFEGNIDVEDFDISQLDEIETEVVKMAPGQAPQFAGVAIPKLSSNVLSSAAESFDLSTAASLTDDLQSMRDKLLQENKQVAVEQLTIKINDGDLDKIGSDQLDAEAKKAIEKMTKERGSEFAGGYQSLDELISGTGGGLQSGFSGKTFLPSDILFDVNKVELKDGSKIAMVKLAYLISINEDAEFTIVGHTDSFGSEEFNRDLSLRRAKSVRDWIVEELQIPTRNVRVLGKGESEPIVPITKTIEEQALNRRVEIEIRKR